MEILEVECYSLKVPIGRTVGDSRLSITDVYWIVVEVTTDTGHTGTGWMGSLGFGPDLMAQFVESQFRDLLLRRSPFEITDIHKDLRRQTIYYGEAGMAAWPRSAIDVALWDIKAQVASEPLYRYLGGTERAIPVYASLMDATEDNVETVANRHGEYANQGFTAFKTKVGKRPAEEEKRRVEAIRGRIGDEADLFVDANQAWTVKEAISHIDALSHAYPSWVEEPISEWDISGHKRVAAAIDPPLATGEMFYRPERFDLLFDVGGVDILQPDLIRLGGVSAMQEVAAMAQRHNVPMAPHFYVAVSAHVVSAAPTGVIVEYIPAYDISEVLVDPLEFDNGRMILPERPGHGYQIAPNARKKYEVDLDV